mmetsp:Transcript_58899/g.172395  ORF Transcript_58899/g.172395 Transcript_58899/m.172395 type:complete len:424 (+) Transcript_58899:40-1311(+)
MATLDFGRALLAAAALLAAGGPATAVVDNPLAHGAPGVLESGMLQGAFEKCVFGGLLLSTIFSWWRGTLGNGQADKQEAGGKPFSFWALGFSCFSLVLLLSDRWYESGHFPLSNMYESLMFLAWGVTAVTLFFAASEGQGRQLDLGSSRKEATTDIAAVWASPTALGIVAFATLSLPKELQKASALVPALQSNWLVMHVSVVMLSYATLMFGSLLCMAVLALSQPKDSPITALREAVVPALRGVANGLSPQPQPVMATSPQVPVAPEAANAVAMSADAEQVPPMAPARMQVAAASGGSVTVEFSEASASPVTLSEDDQLSLTLDDLAYRSLLLGFGFLTIGIVSGAVWANEAWGNYWSWDPKETWALITWFVYAGYLHTRLQLGWDTRDSSKIGAFGFFVVWLCYIGVNLMGVGLHSYGFFLK